ncbi:eukaryotic peptide chain release factor subunit 1-3-like protein [Tanacetum coccineum]
MLLSVFVSSYDDLSRVNEFSLLNLKNVLIHRKKILYIVSTRLSCRTNWCPSHLPHGAKPNNGLAIFAGGVFEEDGEIKSYQVKGNMFKRLNKSSITWDNKYHHEALEHRIRDDKVYGFVVISRTTTTLIESYQE